MNDKEIIQKWKQGLTKNKVAEIYKRIYNEQIKIIRLDVRNRHAGKMISTYEALNKIERVILKSLERRTND